MSIDLSLTQSAQFYVPLSSTSLSDESINELLMSASSNLPEDEDFILNEFRSRREVGDVNYIVSLRIYQTQRPVYFIDGNDYQDKIHALIAFFEIDNHLIIIRKSCAPFQETLDRYFSKISYEKFTNSINSSAHFQKISLRNLTVSDKAVRNKSFEAFDLNGVLSTHTASWSIPYYLRIKDNMSTKAITAGSSRITEYSPRKKLDDIAVWANNQIAQLNSSSSVHEFLSSYAMPIDLAEVLSLTAPSAILIEVPRLRELLKTEGKEVYLTTKNKTVRKLKSSGFKLLFSALEKVYEVENDVIQGVHSSKNK